MTETLVAQRADCAALRTLRWEWRTMPACSARISAMPIYRLLEHALLKAISFRAHLISKAEGHDPWPLSQNWNAAHAYREVIG